MAANVSRRTCAITQRINIRAAGVQGKPAASTICAGARINARNNNCTASDWTLPPSMLFSPALFIKSTKSLQDKDNDD